MSQKLTLVLLASLLGASGCGRSTDTDVARSSGLQRVTLALNWFPEAEHGGFYAAVVHGYYEAEGLDVKIIPGGPGAPVIQQAATERVDFAITNADEVLLGRDQGAPVVAVMAALQESPRCIMVHEHSGIKSLRELRDVTLAIGAGKPFARFLLTQLENAQLTVVPYQGNVTAFLQRDDYAQQAYVFSEPFVAQEHGAQPRCLMLAEIGFNPYSSVLITSEQQIANQADVVGKMVRASVRGWQHYLQEPSETNRRIHELNGEMGAEILAFGAEAIRPLCLPDGADPSRLGQMSRQRWETLAEQLRSIGLLEKPAVVERAFDGRFVDPQVPRAEHEG